MLTRERVLASLKVYQNAWETQDPKLIVTIFTEDAIYHERVFERPVRGHDGIRRYWMTRVVKHQANISFRVLNLYLDGSTAVAEWEASFDDLPQKVRKRIREVAILDFRDDLICGLREYWSTEVLGRLGETKRRVRR